MIRAFAISLLLASVSAIAETPDWQLYGELLDEYVESGEKAGVSLTLVDYERLADEARFDTVVSQVRSFDVSRLASREEKLAFYINAYNILTIRLILDEWPVESIRDIGNIFRGPWDRVMLTNADGELTLDDIEHEIIRSLDEPRIHFAVNCASVSCPDLRMEPYEASRLDAQLAEQTRDFLAESGKGMVVREGTAHVSRLFDWYEEDFEAAGGVADFLLEYAQGIDFKEVRADLEYNWALNDR